jgi:uroporphyrin-III C-methyltransferase/precorrin-2 dehydrogenase/sirohydrochlorin ferrochelatase
MSLFPLFLKLAGRKVLVVGGGPVAAAKVAALGEAGAEVTVIAPEVEPVLAELASAGKIVLALRSFEAADLGGAWFVVAAATPGVNRGVAAAAESQRLFVLAVDDPSAASAYGAGALRRACFPMISRHGRPRPRSSARNGAPPRCRWRSDGPCCCAP